jgi:hypothetical protein
MVLLVIDSLGLRFATGQWFGHPVLALVLGLLLPRVIQTGITLSLLDELGELINLGLKG